MLTIEEIKERLQHYDELTILETLDVEKEHLVELLSDYIEDNHEYLSKELADESYE